MHLSEVKGPVMDALERSSFLRHLTGKVFLSQIQAFQQAMADSGGGENSPSVADPWLARGLI
jgi:SulP family sulfate permease